VFQQFVDLFDFVPAHGFAEHHRGVDGETPLGKQEIDDFYDFPSRCRESGFRWHWSVGRGLWCNSFLPYGGILFNCAHISKSGL